VAVVATAEDVRKFTNIYVSARSFYLHFQKIYEDRGDAGIAELARVAPIFFGDLSAMLKEHIIMNACKITDPARTRKSHNQTTNFFIEHCDFSADPERGQAVSRLSEQMNVFRQRLEPARNKIIAHSDRDTILAQVNLGQASMAEWRLFWQNLQDFLRYLHEFFFAEPFYLTDVAMLTDADSLTRVLSIGLAARDGAHLR
jgi:hypothetical protein